MKKIYSVILILFLSSCLFAQNMQKIYPVDSDIYEAIELLYIAEGKALPSSTGPWSESELRMMLSRMDRKSIREESKPLYDYISEELSKGPMVSPAEEFSLSFPIEINAEIFIHSNPSDFSSPDEHSLKPGRMYGDFNLPDPFLNIPFETWISENFYGYMEFGLSNTRHTHGTTTAVTDNDIITGYRYTSDVFDHNICLVHPYTFADFSMSFPLRAIGAAGGKWWSLSIGRDRLSWGPGETGSLVLGDQVPYHNMIRFTAFTRPFKYTMLVSFYTHPENYYYEEDGTYYFSPEFDQFKTRDKIMSFIAHKIECTMFGNRLGFSITEGIMYQGDTFDFMALSPTAIFHNYYTRGNTNSIVTIDMDVTVCKGVNIYLSFVMDQLQLALEPDASEPSALGILFGSKFSYPMKTGGTFYGSIEFAYTDPYMYLRDWGSEEMESAKYGNSFIVCFPEFVTDGNLSSYTPIYLGYRYGGDAVVSDFKCGYKVFGQWYVQGRFTYVVHGVTDIFTRWTTGDFSSTPSSADNSSGSYNKNAVTKNAVSHTADISIEFRANLLRNLSLGGRFDIINVVSKGNVYGNDAIDIQLSLSLIYDL